MRQDDEFSGAPDDPWASSSERRLAMVAALVTALTAGTVIAAQTYLSMIHHGHDWWRLFVWQTMSWSFWGFAAPILVRRGAKSRGKSGGDVLRANALLSVATVMGHLVVSSTLMMILQPYEPVQRTTLVGALINPGLPWMLIDLLLFWLLLASGRILGEQQRARAFALRESRLEAELAKAQLEALRLKIQPHFLFNTLNSIAALVRKRSNPEALNMLLELSHLLRASLDDSGQQFVTLARELDFSRRYVQLQQHRFGDRLRFSEDVPDRLADRSVPNLVLQPLLENAIQHGLAGRAEGGQVTVRVTELSGQSGAFGHGGLRIEVEDDGEGLPPGFDLSQTSGLGWSSTIERLSHLFPEDPRATLRVEPSARGGTLATLTLPTPADVTTPVQAEGV